MSDQPFKRGGFVKPRMTTRRNISDFFMPPKIHREPLAEMSIKATPEKQHDDDNASRVTSTTIIDDHCTTITGAPAEGYLVVTHDHSGKPTTLVDASTFPTFDDAANYLGYVVAQVERGDFPPNEEDA